MNNITKQIFIFIPLFALMNGYCMNTVSIANVWNVVCMVHQGNIQHVPMILDMAITYSICYQLMAKHVN